MIVHLDQQAMSDGEATQSGEKSSDRPKRSRNPVPDCGLSATRRAPRGMPRETSEGCLTGEWNDACRFGQGMQAREDGS